MRKDFEAQLSFDCTPIEKVEIPAHTKSHLSALATALKYLYTSPKWRQKVVDLLSTKVTKGKKATGRSGMSLWELFVLSQVRLCMNISYEELHHISNYDTMVRGIMGVLPTDYTSGKQYTYQNIYDNVTLLDDEVLRALNEVIVAVGHEVFTKKETPQTQTPALHCKMDSFVVETDTHFPTDYNLLWDSARKCLDTVKKLDEHCTLTGWRKSKEWRRSLKRHMREVGSVSAAGGKHKVERLVAITTAYLTKARALSTKVNEVIKASPILDIRELALIEELEYYLRMLDKHIDLLDRRILQGEAIPHEEKIFSIFQPFTEFIKKGKLRPNVEIGKKLAITTDHHHLIIDWQIANRQADNQLTIVIADRLIRRYDVKSLSVDKGFSDMEDKALLETEIPHVIMPKKGKRSQEEKALESTPLFKKYRNKHCAIESNINELEHRGLNRCMDRSEHAFKRYVGLAVTAYNLHKIGRKLQADQRAAEKRLAKDLRQAA